MLRRKSTARRRQTCQTTGYDARRGVWFLVCFVSAQIESAAFRSLRQLRKIFSRRDFGRCHLSNEFQEMCKLHEFGYSFQFEYARGCRSIRGPKGQGPGNTIIRVRYFLGTFVSSSIWILFFGSSYLHGRLKLIIVATVTHFLLKTQSCNDCVA